MQPVAYIINQTKTMLEDMLSFFRLTHYYIKKHNPVVETYMAITESIKEFLTVNQKIKIARYRVNHYRFRLQQMERLIEENNPNNKIGGKILDQLR